ncbi:hypothetical protein FACS1894147_10920 [Spirochaetia bacterium]|nr:hypothetical protein FACS1894147_10920 [Spirochaetia bacterium]
MMGKYLTLSGLALKYLYRYRRRYAFLFFALLFGFGIITFITALKDSMDINVYYSAQSHYAGDIIANSYDSSVKQTYHMGRAEQEAILEAALDAGIKPRNTVMRTMIGEVGQIYFNGTAIRLKYVLGINWNDEAFIFEKAIFESPPEIPAGDDGIFLSAPVANLLGVRMEDSITLETETRWGQKNTGQFIVRGIVEDASIFGYYKVYVSRLTLNRMSAYYDDDCSSIGFFLEDRSQAEKARLRLQEILAERLQTGPLVNNRDELARETGQPWEGIKIFLYTLPVYLSEVSDLLGAMNIIAYFLYAMILIIIFVSAVVTYRLILYERNREVGIMRAIGFYGADIRTLLWAEVFSLGIISLAGGFIFALILNEVFSLVSFSWFPSFEIFMKDGKLAALYLPKTIFINVVSVFLILAAAVCFPVLHSSRAPLPRLLGVTS